MLKSKKCLFLITGGSHNLGSHISRGLAEEVAAGSTFILTSRCSDRLENVCQAIQTKVGKEKINIHTMQWDFRNPNSDQYEGDLKRALKGVKLEHFDVALIVHNAATLGDLSKKVIDFKNVQELQEQLNINLVSLLALNSIWLNLIKDVKTKLVVNMTAGSATNARPSLGMTSMVKSSRQLTLTVLAKESPEISVLHFDPGAVDTESLRAIRDESHSEQIRQWIAEFYEKGQVLQADHVVKALLKTLNDGKYESGTYVSAYDVKI